MKNRMEIQGLTYGYRSEPTIKEIDFTVRSGEWLGIVGPNGSGKSTVLRMLAKLARPQGGQVLLDGANLAGLSPKEAAQKLSMLAQNQDSSLDITVRDLVKKGRHPHLKWFQDGSGEAHEEIVDWAIAATSLQALQHRRLTALSGGERQRAWLAMAVCQTPATLLLDEPATYLDIAHQLELMELVRRLNREKGITVVMVLHDLNQAARYCDRLLAVKNGKIAAEGTPVELFREDFFREVFGVEGRVRMEEGIPSFQPLRTIVTAGVPLQ